MTFHYPIKQLILSHSALSTLDNCAKKFEQAVMFGKPAVRENSFAADVGNALHDGMQEWLISRDENKAIWEMLKAYPFENEYLDSKNRDRSMEACISVLQHFFGAAMLDRYELIYVNTKKGVKPAVEVPFAFRITGSPFDIPVWYVGFEDIIMYDRVENVYLVVDIKTTRIAANEARYQWDQQVLPYGIILEHMLGHDFTGRFKIAYLHCYVDLLEPKLEMFEFVKTQEDVQAWYFGLCQTIEQLHSYYKSAFFPRARDGSHCFAWNKPCFWIDTCAYSDPATLGRVLGGTPRTTLFSDPTIEPWIEVELPFLKAA